MSAWDDPPWRPTDKQDSTPCPHCDGRGTEIEENRLHLGGQVVRTTIVGYCPICLGTGNIPPASQTAPAGEQP